MWKRIILEDRDVDRIGSHELQLEIEEALLDIWCEEKETKAEIHERYVRGQSPYEYIDGDLA